MSQITLDLKPNIVDKLNNYIKLFGSKELFFEKFIKFHKNRLKREIAHIQIDLNKFERKYNKTSEDFFKKFEKGELGDDKDFMIWAGIYEMQIESKKKLSKLL